MICPLVADRQTDRQRRTGWSELPDRHSGGQTDTRVAQSEFLKILRFRVVAEKVHSAQPKSFTRRAQNTSSQKIRRSIFWSVD